MRISDWSSDVCSSDLVGFGEQRAIDHFHMLATFRRWIAGHSDKYCLVGTAADVQNARASNRLGICFDIEGMNALDETVDLIPLYYDLGVRWMLLTYNNTTHTSGGCLAEDAGDLPDH